MEILVTGSTGTIGSHLIKLLQAFGVPFKAMVRSESNAEILKTHGFPFVMGDFDQPDSLAKAMEGVGRLFLLSAPTPNQVEQQTNALQAAKEAGVQHIVKVSAVGASADSPVQLFRWHAEIEEAIKQSGISYTFLHPQSFMQNFFGYLPTIQKQNAFYAPMQDRKIPLIDAHDVGAVAAKILVGGGHHNKTYVLTGGEAISHQKIAELFSKLLGRTIQYVDISFEAAQKAMLDMGMADWLVNDLIALNKELVGDNNLVDPSVREITGMAPTTFEQFLADHLEIFKGDG